MRVRFCVLLALVATGLPARGATVPRLQHIFVIVEENTDAGVIFGTSAKKAPYLNSLANDHVRHDAYYGTTHPSVGNYIAMVSGQDPHPEDKVDCYVYHACLRPGPTIGAQLDEAGLTWRAYMQGMARPCQTPPLPIDQYQTGYATRHNPFVYFLEIATDGPYCAEHDVPFENNFAADLAAGPANYNLIVPDTCNDGHDQGCKGDKTKVQILDEWLAMNVPPIVDFVLTHEASALFITFDEADNDDAGCCTTRAQPPIDGGGRIGFAMVASPDVERGGGVRVTTPGNHFSFLRTLEDGFGLEPLGEAATAAPMVDLFR